MHNFVPFMSTFKKTMKIIYKTWSETLNIQDLNFSGQLILWAS